MNPQTPAPKIVIPSTRGRDTIIALIVGAVILAFVIFGISTMGTRGKSENVLKGMVVGKQFTPQREEQVSFSGRKLEGTKVIEGEYVLKVRVDSENRTYEVPVEKGIYDAKKEGDSLEFVRPPSEQK